VFTTYRKSVEPLRKRPRAVLPKPSSLPPLPTKIPSEQELYKTPVSLEDLISTLLAPIDDSQGLRNPPRMPGSGAQTAHPFHGGSSTGHDRIKHLISSGHMTSYKDTRNGLLGADFSTKLSAWLALGCITARQVHASLLKFEDGASDADASFRNAPGFGQGENKGTAAVRFELLWRDYMRLCHRKFGDRLFRMSGFRGAIAAHGDEYQWKDPAQHKEILVRFLEGRTGTGLIDASMRELFLTGYTSNRARQNVASFLAKHLGIDWRVGAEWYESMLVDYDVSSNWGNWAYVAGVGNDPRGDNGSGRIFNPVKQASDYDPQGECIKTWVEELRDVRDVQGVWQAWKIPHEEKKSLGLQGLEWVERPLKRIQFGAGRGGAARGGRHEQGSHGQPQGGHHKKRQGRGNGKKGHVNTYNAKE
jgi:deoxyribodipyrimidine photo-lyase